MTTKQIKRMAIASYTGDLLDRKKVNRITKISIGFTLTSSMPKDQRKIVPVRLADPTPRTPPHGLDQYQRCRLAH